MASPIHTPRVNNNDDIVKLITLEVRVGDAVKAGQMVAQVETDKAIVEVEAPADGFLLGWTAEVDQMVAVGSVLAWIGATKDEAVPQPQADATPAAAAGSATGQPTAKARMLLLQHGLQADQVPASGERLSADDVLRYVAQRPGAAKTQRASAPVADATPQVAGARKPLSGSERGMLQTVSWSREHAVPGYLEIEFDPAPWDAYAKGWAEARRLMMTPLLPLMAWRLVELARETPVLNATIAGNDRFEFDAVNLGFTVQAGDTLYLAVTRQANTLGEEGFVNQLGEIQRRAMKHQLSVDELTGATVSFSSMARWKISRHIPVLPPQTALIVAHAQSASGVHVLGATYDHRVLSGFQVAQLLRKLAKPGATPEQDS
ncbi:2-oxo acid dehydrogenase subunit E2 [Burkholderiaceae bacterium UC74_6]